MDDTFKHIDRREKFAHLTELKRDMTLFDMFVEANSQHVKLMLRVVDLEADRDFLKRELEGIAHRRSDTQPLLNTDEKIQIAIDKEKEKEFDWGAWGRDKILPPLVIGSIYAVIGLLVWALSQGWKP